MLTVGMTTPDPRVWTGYPSGEGKLGWLAVVLGTTCSKGGSCCEHTVNSLLSTFTKNPTLNLTVDDQDFSFTILVHRERERSVPRNPGVRARAINVHAQNPLGGR